MPLKILFENKKLVRKGRPAFSASTNRNIPVIKGLEDRRHILHGATQITDVLIGSFNRVIKKKGIVGLKKVINGLQRRLKAEGYKIATTAKSPLEAKLEEIITIAFGKEENLVAGLAVQNQGIEKARKTINVIRAKLDDYCAGEDIRNLAEIRSKVVELINTSLDNNRSGRVAMYRTWILKVLKEAIEKAKDEVEIIRTLDAFEFSCTLDIVHDKTTKEQNIWGLIMANRLHQAISNCDEESIYDVLLLNSNLKRSEASKVVKNNRCSKRQVCFGNVFSRA